MVAVCGGRAVMRRRIEMREEADVGSAQPYHYAAKLDIRHAAPYLLQAKAAAVQRAAGGLREALEALRSDGYRVHRAAVLMGSGKPLPELDRILAAHPLVHTAEGIFFREILKAACADCALPVEDIRERDVLTESASEQGISMDELRGQMTAMGKALGPPWTTDEKLASAAALAIAE
jgi:hypothetical protein